MEPEYIHGFTIPKRELTDEEKSREITLDRFSEFHCSAGEDFCDQVGTMIDHTLFGGWLMHKYPDKSPEILEEVNNKYGEVMGYQELYEDDECNDAFYTDLAEFLNLTTNTKARVNQILIQVTEHYNR